MKYSVTIGWRKFLCVLFRKIKKRQKCELSYSWYVYRRMRTGKHNPHLAINKYNSSICGAGTPLKLPVFPTSRISSRDPALRVRSLSVLLRGVETSRRNCKVEVTHWRLYISRPPSWWVVGFSTRLCIAMPWFPYFSLVACSHHSLPHRVYMSPRPTRCIMTFRFKHIRRLRAGRSRVRYNQPSTATTNCVQSLLPWTFFHLHYCNHWREPSCFVALDECD